MSIIIQELYSIMPIANIASVMKHGILSHKQAAMLPHADISMQAVQERRDQRLLHSEKKLHEYANLLLLREESNDVRP